MRVYGDQVEGFPSLKSMREASDIVVIGSVDDFGEIRRIQGDAPEDLVMYVTLSLEVAEVITGQVASKSVPVEFLFNYQEDAVDRTLDELSEALPKGEMLLFLRAKRGEGEGGLYRLVNDLGLWTSNGKQVDAPLRERIDEDHHEHEDGGHTDPTEEETPYLDEVEGRASLRDLAESLAD